MPAPGQIGITGLHAKQTAAARARAGYVNEVRPAPRLRSGEWAERGQPGGGAREVNECGRQVGREVTGHRVLKQVSRGVWIPPSFEQVPVLNDWIYAKPL